MKTYLFDFDGTLVDSMPTYVSSMLHILDKNNITYDDSIIKTVTPLGLIGSAKYYIQLGVPGTVEEIVKQMADDMLEAYINTIPAKKNVIKTLQELKKQGASLNVLTASPHISLDPCLKRLGIFDIFDNVWSCDDFNTTKADPEIYKMVAKRLNKDVSEILFLDDNLDADLTAKKAGMLVSGVFDESSREYTERIKAETDFYIQDFIELLDITF